MLKIALCDDDFIFRDKLDAALKEYSAMQMSDPEFLYKLKYFSTSTELLDATEEYDVLFLDIGLENGIDGIKVGKRLRLAGNRVPIILLTSMRRYADGYEITPFRYLTKPIDHKKLFAAMDDLQQELFPPSVMLKILLNGAITAINQSDITYVDCLLRIRTVHTRTESYQTYVAWEEIEKQLSGKLFYLVRRHCIVNLKYVADANKYAVTMRGGEVIPFTRGDRTNGVVENFQRAFNEYLDMGGS